MPAHPTLAATVMAAVDRSAAPAAVRAALRRLVEVRPELADRLAEDATVREALIAVLAASRSLTRYFESWPDAIDVLSRLEEREPRIDTTVADLVAWKQREFVRITARDLTGVDWLVHTTSALTELAADVLDGACLLAQVLSGADESGSADGAAPSGQERIRNGHGRLAVIGMGKLGGSELNYASDVDIIFVGDGPAEALERQARAVIDIAGRCFRVDSNLRPQGRDGALVRSVDSYEAYWDRWADPWEFQALIKARPVAGDAKLGALFDDTAHRWLWSRPFAADDLRSVRQMKRRAETEVARKGLTDRDIKRGRGGIRDIEFTVQLLQLVHGHSDPGLRSPTTLRVLSEMAAAGYIDPSDGAELGEAYRFLRAVEHRLQLRDERQIHTVPADRPALDRLARVLGYRDHAGASAVEQLDHILLRHQLTVRSIHERVYFRPLLEAFAEAPGSLSPEAAVARLTAFGFTDAARTQVAVRELTRGLNRSSRLMQQMLPLILDWLSTAPNPDMGLLMLRTLLSGARRTGQLIDAFRDSPEAAQRLCIIVGTSRLLADILVHNPDLVVRLPSEDRLRTRPRRDLVTAATSATSWRTGLREQQLGLRRWKNRNLLGIGARDVHGSADVAAVGSDLTVLAEATVEVALRSLKPTIPFGVLALGRFGGAELSYASDLDLIFVYEGKAAAAGEALRIASGLLRFLRGVTPADQIYPIDVDLRPEGKHGPLARSVEGFTHYWERYAMVWERQAMIRARPVAGDQALAQRLLDELEPFVWEPGLSENDELEIRRMKARIERERIPFGEDPQFHLKLGRGSLSDIEFTAQLLQLRHRIRSPGTMQALELLAAAGRLDAEDAELLMTSYRYCEQTRNRWYLVNSKVGNSLPAAPQDLLWLARSLDLTPSELRERHRRVTRRARRVVEQVFYGQD